MGFVVSNINDLLPILIIQQNQEKKKSMDEEIEKKLFSNKWMARAEAAKEIGNLKIEDANKFLPELYKRLDKNYEKDEIVRVYVIKALAKLYDKEALNYLTEVSKDEKEKIIVLNEANKAIDEIKKHHKIIEDKNN